MKNDYFERWNRTDMFCSYRRTPESPARRLRTTSERALENSLTFSLPLARV